MACLILGDLARTARAVRAPIVPSEAWYTPFSRFAMAFACVNCSWPSKQDEEASYVEFWQVTSVNARLGSRHLRKPSAPAFNDFYKAFDEWLPPQLPSHVDQVTIQILWPDMEANPPDPGGVPLHSYLPQCLWEANSNPRGRYVNRRPEGVLG